MLCNSNRADGSEAPSVRAGRFTLLWRGNNYLLPTEEEMEYASDANDNMWEDPDFWIDVTDLKDTDIPTASSEAAQ